MLGEQEVDIVKQIQESLRYYDGEYTVDILFDWMKLLFFPQNRWLKTLPRGDITRKDWGIASEDFMRCKAYCKDVVDIETVKDNYSVRNVAKHLHNSAIHYWFLYFPISGEIEKMVFMNKKDERSIFELDISVKSYRTFLLKFSEMMLANHL